MGITTEGVKIPLGLWEGSTENATVATALLSDLVERGLDPEQGMLFVLDGSKALRKAVRSVFGEVPVQRCLWHKERNVLGHLPERDRPPIKARMRRAWRETDYPRALEQLTRLADELEHTHPGAAGSLREGMDETLTVIKLGIKGKLRRTLESTNACESMIDTVRTTQRNVKHWSSGEMGLRWTAAGMLEAEKQFRKVIGYTDLPAPRRRDRTPTPPSPAQPRHDPGGRDRSHCVTITPGPPSPKFHDERDNLDSGGSSSSWSRKSAGFRSQRQRRRGPLSIGRLFAVGVNGDCVKASIREEPFDRRDGRPYPGPVWVDVRRDAPRMVRRPHERGRATQGELRQAPNPSRCRLTPDLSR